jgi:hypothetical protein
MPHAHTARGYVPWGETLKYQFNAERTDAVDRAGLRPFHGSKSIEPARQLILGVRPQRFSLREGEQKRAAPPRPTARSSPRRWGFPIVEQLRRGIVLNCIAHSFWLTAHEPVFEMDWDGDTYFEDNIQGEHWAVSFPEGGAVAVFYSTESPRNPFPEGSPPYDQSWYFRGMSPGLEAARDRALSQMLDFDFRCRNPAKAVITAAMWANGERFTAVEPWMGVYDNSGRVLQTHLLPPEEALREW